MFLPTHSSSTFPAASSFSRGGVGGRCLLRPPALPELVGSRRRRRRWRCPIFSSPSSDFSPEDDGSSARSQFGTHEYWDEMYNGLGDFPPDEYSWYYGWDVLKPHWTSAVPAKSSKVLVPGVGNDPLLLDLHRAGYRRLTAFDYAESAIERQSELLSYEPGAVEDVGLHVMDARRLDETWTGTFDAILEKGALDAVYLSGDGNVERAVTELRRVLKPGGTFVSVSGVVPEDLRREMFDEKGWELMRDGTDDLKAGCFVWRKR